MRNVLACLVMVIELLLHGERDLHRPPRDHRERGHQRLELDIELAAEAAAEIRHLDAHAVLRPAEQPRDLDAHERRALRRAVDGDAGLLRSRRSRHRARAARCSTFWVRKVCSNTCVGLREGLVDVAAAQPEIERDIGALAALEMLEIGEGAGGLELLVHERFVVRASTSS